MLTLPTLKKEHYIQMAKELANNHSKFNAFCWASPPDDAEKWCLVHTQTRDSGMLAKANSEAIHKVLQKYIRIGHVIPQSFGHWLCGWVSGYAIRVYSKRGNTITAAFKTWCNLAQAIADYPVLDNDLYSRMEYNAALDSIKDNAPATVEDRLPKTWLEQVYSDIANHDNGDELRERDGSVWVDTDTIFDAIIRIDPTWLEVPFKDDEEGAIREAYDEIVAHIAQLDKDLEAYCIAVPHAAAKARKDADELRIKLEAKKRKLVRNHYSKGI